MGLESGTYVNDLVITNPVGATDERRFGDDHLRLIKSVLRNTFPDGNQPLRFLRYELRGANAQLVAADKGKTIVSNANFTQTFASAATLGNGWWIFYRNESSAPQLLDITLNGITPFLLNHLEEVMIISSGSVFYPYWLNPKVLIDTRTGVHTSFPFTTIGSTLNPRFKSYELRFEGLIPINNANELHFQYSTDNGSSWFSGATYQHVRHIAGHAGVDLSTGMINDTKALLLTGCPNSSPIDGKIEIVPAAGRITWELNYVQDANKLSIVRGWSTASTSMNAFLVLFSNGGAQNLPSPGMRFYGLI